MKPGIGNLAHGRFPVVKDGIVTAERTDEADPVEGPPVWVARLHGTRKRWVTGTGLGHVRLLEAGSEGWFIRLTMFFLTI